MWPDASLGGRRARGWARGGSSFPTRGCQPQYSSHQARTLLSFPAECRHAAPFKMLLEHENADPNTPDTWYGQTPLAFTAWSNYEGAINIILEREDLSPNMADSWNG